MTKNILCNDCERINKILNKINLQSYYIAFELDTANKIVISEKLKEKIVFF